MEDYINPSDILVVIGANQKPNTRAFMYDGDGTEKFMRFFYEQKPQFPELSSINFNTSGMFPDSRELRQAVINLFTTGLIAVATSSPRHYHFTQLCDKSFNKFVKKRLNDYPLLSLEEIARRFSVEVAVPNTIKV